MRGVNTLGDKEKRRRERRRIRGRDTLAGLLRNTVAQDREID